MYPTSKSSYTDVRNLASHRHNLRTHVQTSTNNWHTSTRACFKTNMVLYVYTQYTLKTITQRSHRAKTYLWVQEQASRLLLLLLLLLSLHILHQHMVCNRPRLSAVLMRLCLVRVPAMHVVEHHHRFGKAVPIPRRRVVLTCVARMRAAERHARRHMNTAQRFVTYGCARLHGRQRASLTYLTSACLTSMTRVDTREHAALPHTCAVQRAPDERRRADRKTCTWCVVPKQTRYAWALAVLYVHASARSR